VCDLPIPFRRCDVPRFPLEPLFGSRDSFINNAKETLFSRVARLLFISFICDIHAFARRILIIRTSHRQVFDYGTARG
jgi:hypothetical protein